MTRREAFNKSALDNLASAHEEQRFHANKNRRVVTLDVGDPTILNTDGTSANKHAKVPTKWRPGFMGPLRVLEKIGKFSYEIDLPPAMNRTYNVLHVNKLKKLVQDGTNKNRDIVINAEGHIEQDVAEILKKRTKRVQLQFLVRFQGDSLSEALWIYKPQLQNCKQLIKDYEKTRVFSN